MIKVTNKILPNESAFETALKDALKYLNDDDDINGIEYHLGTADGKLFKLVIEPEDVNQSFDYAVVTQSSMAYEVVFESLDNAQHNDDSHE